MTNHLCTHCNQPHVVQDAHKEHLTKIKCEMLKAAASHVLDTGVNQFKNKNIADGHSSYGNLQKLRYHGLIAQVRTGGKKHRGLWLITKNGWALLRGELKLPKFVLVKDNHPLDNGRSDVLVGLLDVLKGGDYMETTFDYYDEETGEMIGKRPVVYTEPEQTTLLDVPVTKKYQSFA